MNMDIELKSQPLGEPNAYMPFYENLKSRLSPQEITSLHVLGQEFFEIVDFMCAHLLQERDLDHRLLDLDFNEFLWELQIFGNLFVRAKAPSLLRLKSFCQETLTQLKNDDFYEEIMQEFSESYEDYFFISESEELFLN